MKTSLVVKGTFARAAFAIVAAIAVAFCSAEAQEKKKSTIKGAGLGALLGQAIGGDTEATLIGGAIGAGVGHVIGNEKDKEKAEELSKQQSQPAPKPAQPAPNSAQPAPIQEEADVLAGTTWAVGSVSPKENIPEFRSKIVEFRDNGKVSTTTTATDNTVTLSEESYRVVDDVLIINKPGYIINARFSVDGDQLIIKADEFSAVLFRLNVEE